MTNSHVAMRVTVVTITIKIPVSSVHPVPRDPKDPKVRGVQSVRKVLSVPQEHRARRGFPEAYSVMQIFMH